MIFRSSFVYDSARLFEIFKHTNTYTYMVCSILLGLVGTSLFLCKLHEMNKQHTDKLQINLPIVPCDFIGETTRNGTEQKAESHSRSME